MGEDFNECASSPCSNGECQSHSTDFHCGYDITSLNDMEIVEQSTTGCIGGQCTGERITTCANIKGGSAFDCSGEDYTSVLPVCAASVRCENRCRKTSD